MKRISLFVVLLSLCFMVMGTSQAYAWTVKLAWNANTESDLAGYKLYHTNTQGSYDMGNPEQILDANAVETTTIVPDGFHCWVLTAFDLSGNESGPSDEVCITLPDDAPVYDHAPPVKPDGFMPVEVWE